MKKITLFAVVLTVTLIASMSIFYACKKAESVKIPTQQKSINIDLSGIDFKKIGMTHSRSEGSMLVFETFEDYAEIIDALLAVCEQYSADYLVELERELGKPIDKANEDEVAAIISRDNFFPYYPTRVFLERLGYSESAYTMLLSQEMEWLNGSSLEEGNPFEEVGVGYIQSTLHNQFGNVQIGGIILDWDVTHEGETPNPNYTCKKDAEQYRDSPEFSYGGKKRKLKGLLRTHSNRTYCKTACYYKNTFGNWILWTNTVYVEFSGRKSLNCPTNTMFTSIPTTKNSSWTGLTEKYYWHDITPTYLMPTPQIIGKHKCNNYSHTVITNL